MLCVLIESLIYLELINDWSDDFFFLWVHPVVLRKKSFYNFSQTVVVALFVLRQGTLALPMSAVSIRPFIPSFQSVAQNKFF